MNNEDRELQIDLARFQTDVQIYLTLSVSVAALFVALIISFQQLTVNATSPFQIYSFLIGMLSSAFLAFMFVRVFIKKLNAKRMELEELKKKYVQVKT